MPLKVVCFCTYLTTIGSAWRPRDFDAHDFIHAIKGRQINKYAQIPVLGTLRRLDNSNLDDALEWVGEKAARYFERNNLDPPFVFVPVPSSKTDLRSTKPSRPLLLAQKIANKIASGSRAKDLLRFKKKMPSANEQGGTRDPSELYQSLVLVGDLPRRPIVLVDDVLTSGGHLRACAAMLKENGATVLMATCAGRADAEQPAKPFAVREIDLDEFYP